MQTKFNGNYIKRISYYVGIIAFVAYLIIALVMWIMDTHKEVDNIVNNAKAELAPLIQWYEKDSTKELESIQNITQESLNALNINATIHQNLQDIQRAMQRFNTSKSHFKTISAQLDKYTAQSDKAKGFKVEVEKVIQKNSQDEKIISTIQSKEIWSLLRNYISGN